MSVDVDSLTVEDAYSELGAIADRLRRHKAHEAALLDRRKDLCVFLIGQGEKQAVVARKAGVSPSRVDQTVNGKVKARQPKQAERTR